MNEDLMASYLFLKKYRKLEAKVLVTTDEKEREFINRKLKNVILKLVDLNLVNKQLTF